MKIGIIGAMEEEIKALREQLISPLSWERGGALFISGSIGNHEVIVVRSGIWGQYGDQYWISWWDRCRLTSRGFSDFR